MKARRLFTSAGASPRVRFVYFSRFVRKHLHGRRGLRVLDAGFGGGEYTGNTYTDNFAWAKGKIRTDQVRLFIKDLKNMDHKSVFGTIYSKNVLIHVPGSETVLHRIFDALEEGGYG